MESEVLVAKAQAQDAVRTDAKEFLLMCSPENPDAPVNAIIVYRLPNGGLGYLAPPADGIAQVGLLDLCKLALSNKMLKVE